MVGEQRRTRNRRKLPKPGKINLWWPKWPVIFSGIFGNWDFGSSPKDGLDGMIWICLAVGDTEKLQQVQ